MIKGNEIRKPNHPIEKLLIDRWSPRTMSGEEISQEELMRLFEAARWAPSSFNTQQWRALYAFLRLRRSLGELRAARLSPRSGGPWDAGIRLRSRA
jgi:nitroreductase